MNEKKERQGRNPKTGEAMTIAARSVAVFKPSKELGEDLNEKARPLATRPRNDVRAKTQSVKGAYRGEGLPVRRMLFVEFACRP